MFCFGLELRGIAGGIWLVQPGVAELGAEVQAFVHKGLVNLEPAFDPWTRK